MKLILSVILILMATAVGAETSGPIAWTQGTISNSVAVQDGDTLIMRNGHLELFKCPDIDKYDEIIQLQEKIIMNQNQELDKMRAGLSELQRLIKEAKKGVTK